MCADCLAMRVRVVAFAFIVGLTACSTMDDVEVLHECAGTIEVVVTHRSAIKPEGGAQKYWEQTYRGEAPPGEVTTVAGIINLYRHDLVRVEVEGSTWKRELSRQELRAIGGPIEIPTAACPAGP